MSICQIGCHRLRTKSNEWLLVRCIATIENQSSLKQIRCTYRLADERYDLGETKNLDIETTNGVSSHQISPLSVIMQPGKFILFRITSSNFRFGYFFNVNSHSSPNVFFMRTTSTAIIFY